MADCADNSDLSIFTAVASGLKKAERELVNNKLRPIVFDIGKERAGVCHWCESYIIPGRLFCEKDPNDSGMCCSESYDHDNKRRKDSGV